MGQRIRGAFFISTAAEAREPAKHGKGNDAEGMQKHGLYPWWPAKQVFHCHRVKARRSADPKAHPVMLPFKRAADSLSGVFLSYL